MQKVLYIAGYGRSGSTILDVILGSHPEMVSVGELTYLLDDWADPARRCACGAPYERCPFWGGFFDEALFDENLSEDMAERVRRIERRRGLLPVLLNRLPPAEKQQYRAFQRRLFCYIRARSGKPVVVDSSKSARDAALRGYALSEIAGLDVHLLHLVRGGTATMHSFLKQGSNWALEGHARQGRLPGLRAAVGWTLTNAWTAFLLRRWFEPDRYLRVHFEELVTEPVAVLERIGGFVGGARPRALAERAACGAPFEVGHNVGGNRLRKAGAVRLKVRERREERPEVDRFHRAFFGAVGGWLQHYLGSNTDSE